MEIVTRVKRFLFRAERKVIDDLKAELRKEVQSLQQDRASLRAERERVSRLVPVPSDVNNMLRDVLNARMSEFGICKDEEGREQLLAQIQLLRRHLRQELAVNEYLTENQKEGVLAFNGLSVEARRAYFEKVDAKL
jgi:sugar-specific transcriptional regulator TrmB